MSLTEEDREEFTKMTETSKAVFEAMGFGDMKEFIEEVRGLLGTQAAAFNSIGRFCDAAVVHLQKMGS